MRTPLIFLRTLFARFSLFFSLSGCCSCWCAVRDRGVDGAEASVERPSPMELSSLVAPASTGNCSVRDPSHCFSQTVSGTRSPLRGFAVNKGTSAQRGCSVERFGTTCDCSICNSHLYIMSAPCACSKNTSGRGHWFVFETQSEVSRGVDYWRRFSQQLLASFRPGNSAGTGLGSGTRVALPCWLRLGAWAGMNR